jgi:hypothetical protein
MNAPKLSSLRTTGALLASVLFSLIYLSGCGSGGTGTPINPYSGTTMVTLLASSDANGKFTELNLQLTGLTLTDKSGTIVTALSTSQTEEFVHLNGTAEPLTTFTVPQGLYTTATATVGSAFFSCVTLLPNNGGLDTSTYAYGATPSSQVSVTVPAPLSITGNNLVLQLGLHVSTSAVLQGSCGLTPVTYSINPTFTLAPLTLASTPTNSSNGLLQGLSGLVSAVDATSGLITIAGVDGPTWYVNTTSQTAFNGISGLAALTVGMPVNMDLGLQSSGSLLANRIAVENANTSDLQLWRGPLTFVSNAAPVVYMFPRDQAGYFTKNLAAGGEVLNNSSSTFQISNQLPNLASLPFTPVFSATNLVPGQSVSVTTNIQSLPLGSGYPTLTTTTLVPQTINGTISVISNQGSFTTYTVTLASYDPFTNLAVQPGQNSLIANPAQIVVYADANTQSINSPTLAVGQTVRFYGLVFNDGGVLRMDCAQIAPGIPE